MEEQRTMKELRKSEERAKGKEQERYSPNDEDQRISNLRAGVEMLGLASEPRSTPMTAIPLTLLLAEPRNLQAIVAGLNPTLIHYAAIPHTAEAAPSVPRQLRDAVNTERDCAARWQSVAQQVQESDDRLLDDRPLHQPMME